MNIRLGAPLALAAMLVAAPVLAVKPVAQPVTLTNSWVREAPPGAEVMAAYFTVKNNQRQAIVLKGVTSPLFGRVEMHEVKQDAGRVKMEEVQSFKLKPGETLTLAPGGAHLMMFEPKRALKADEKVPFTLDFGQAGKVTAQFPVQRQAPGTEGHKHHGQHHDGAHDHHHH